MEEMTTASAAPATEAAPAAAPASEPAQAPAPANVFAFGPESDPDGGDSAAEQVGEEAPAPEANRSAEEEPSDGGDGQQPEDNRQKKVGHAFAQQNRKMQQMRAENEALRNDPDRLIGRRLVEDLMAREGMTEEQARQTLDERYAAAYAKRENIGEGVARDIELLKRQVGLKNNSHPPDQQGNEEFDADARAAEIKDEIANMELPEGFDPEAAYADPGFAELLLDMPTKAAVRVYAAEKRAANASKDLAEKLRARQAIPQSERPNAPVSAQVNYMNMSSEDFWAEKARRDKLMR